MSKKDLIGVTVMVDDEHRDKLELVAHDLKVQGFVLSESLGAIGVLTGSAPAEAVPTLTSVPGVSAVEENRDDYRTQNE